MSPTKKVKKRGLDSIVDNLTSAAIKKNVSKTAVKKKMVSTAMMSDKKRFNAVPYIPTSTIMAKMIQYERRKSFQLPPVPSDCYVELPALSTTSSRGAVVSLTSASSSAELPLNQYHQPYYLICNNVSNIKPKNRIIFITTCFEIPGYYSIFEDLIEHI